MARKTILLLFSFFLPLAGQNYLWPTNASHALTSSFCEYRPAHYHAALDIKTWNREGFPIFAVDDGVVYRIRVSPFGYGKGLYLRMNDGRIAVYAHLQKFNNKIEQLVFDQQIKKQRYSVQFFPKGLKVKKGQVLGYTGQTGIGSPHLHFEIRDPQDHPINPLAFYNVVEDHIAPVLQHLLVIPLGRESRADGTHLPKVLKLEKTDRNSYRIPQPVPVKGMIGLAFECYDMADGVYNKYAHYQAVLYLNDSKIFQSSYDTLDFDLTSQVDIDIYYPQKAWYDDVYNKLYIDPYNELSFYRRGLGNGKIQVDSIQHFRLEVSDYFGNTSTLTGVLEPEQDTEAQLSLVKKIGENLFINVAFPQKINHLQLQTKEGKGAWKEVPYYEFLRPLERNTRYHTMLKVKTGGELVDSLRCIFQTADGLQGRGSMTLNELEPRKVEPLFLNTGRALVVQAQNVVYRYDLRLEISNESVRKTVVPEIRNGRLEQVIAAEYFPGDSLQLRLVGGNFTVFDTTVYLKAFYPDTAMTYRTFDGEIEFSSAKHTFYDTMLVSFDRIAPESAAHGAVLLAPKISMTSNPLVFRQPAKLRVKIEPTTFPARQIAFYEPDIKGKWEYMGGTADTVHHTLTVSLGKIGNYYIAADTAAPQVEIMPLSQKQLVEERPLFKLSARDELAGLGGDENIFITVDGKFVIPEWDFERDIITCRPHWNLAAGNHELKAVISDQCGNRTVKTYRFTK